MRVLLLGSALAMSLGFAVLRPDMAIAAVLLMSCGAVGMLLLLGSMRTLSWLLAWRRSDSP